MRRATPRAGGGPSFTGLINTVEQDLRPISRAEAAFGLHWWADIAPRAEQIEGISVQGQLVITIDVDTLVHTATTETAVAFVTYRLGD